MFCGLAHIGRVIWGQPWLQRQFCLHINLYKSVSYNSVELLLNFLLSAVVICRFLLSAVVICSFLYDDDDDDDEIM